jgi:hypothetical protein
MKYVCQILSIKVLNHNIFSWYWARSAQGKANITKLEYPHTMGSHDYKAKTKWKDEGVVIQSSPSAVLTQDMDDKSFQFLLGHSREVEPGVYEPTSSNISGVLERVV